MSTPCYYCELDRDSCKLCIHKVDTLYLLQQTRREGWEQAKRKCVKISMGMFDCNGEEIANVIDALEYKEPTNDCTRI